MAVSDASVLNAQEVLAKLLCEGAGLAVTDCLLAAIR